MERGEEAGSTGKEGKGKEWERGAKAGAKSRLREEEDPTLLSSGIPLPVREASPSAPFYRVLLQFYHRPFYLQIQ